MTKIEVRQLIRQMMEVIVLCELEKEKSLEEADYMNQRTLISSLFGEGYGKGQIILRLTVIDSLYSTNAGYSYFSFEEMADKILSLGDRTSARKYFYSVALTGEDKKEVFSEPYGIQKNLSEGAKQMSLMSKYAYYELLQDRQSYPLGFPIYDRLAKKAYPTVCKMLGLSFCYNLPDAGTPSIKEYIASINQIRKELFDSNDLFVVSGKQGYQQYDILDAYLWRMGKFDEGNLSLLLGRNAYIQFIENLGLAAPKTGSGNTRKETDSYKAQMLKEYQSYCSKDVKEVDFNKLIALKLQNSKRPFRSIDNEDYLSALLNHWFVFSKFESQKIKKVSFEQK